MDSVLHIWMVNYFSSHHIERLLTSINLKALNLKLVILNNGESTNGHILLLELARNHPNISVIESPENIGFGAGINKIASEYADLPSFMWIVNPDTMVRTFNMTGVLKEMRAQNFSMASSYVISGEFDRPNIWFAGGTLEPQSGECRHTDFGKPALLSGPSAPTQFVSGASFFITKDAWLDSQGFDEDFFLYWEDADLSKRVQRAGGNLGVLSPNISLVWHEEGGSSRRSRRKSRVFFYYMAKNRILLAKKWSPQPHFGRLALANLRLAASALKLDVFSIPNFLGALQGHLKEIISVSRHFPS